MLVYNSFGSSTEERLMFLPCMTRMEDIDIGRELCVDFSIDQTIWGCLILMLELEGSYSPSFVDSTGAPWID